MGKVKVSLVSYGGWKNCVLMGNGVVELVVTVDVGPRIIRFGFKGRQNQLCEIPSELGLTGGDGWRLYGGHRLWHGPEDKVRTYVPDNGPVSWEEIQGGVRVTQDAETTTGIRKEIEIVLSPEGSGVRLLHRLKNEGQSPAVLFVWSITAMAPGGASVVPQSRRETGLLPNRLVSLWPYSRLDDPRVVWGARHIVLEQDPSVRHPFKFGIPNEEGWAAYFNHGDLFVKRHHHRHGAMYPDFGVSYESYTNDLFLEMETLSPLARLAAGESAEHGEEWELFGGVAMPVDEEEIESALKGKATSKERR